MGSVSVRELIGFIGVAAQLGGSLLLAVLFVLLRRYAVGRQYFIAWGGAWIAVSVAILALVVRFFGLSGHPDGSREVLGLLAIYQFSKLAYVLLMAVGATLYVRGPGSFPRGSFFAAGAVLYTGVSVLAAGALDPLVVWQAPLMIFGLTYCAYQLLTLGADRRSLGSIGSGICFALIAVLWTIYLTAFGVGRAIPGSQPEELGWIVNYNAYLDLLLQMLLGYAMVVLLMEDAKRDVDTAHTALAVAHEQLRTASFHDALTGALNRRAFAEGVGLEGARRQGGAVVALDLDNLKLVNDSFGHSAGDRLLRRLAEVVRSIVRPSDQLYRWGGDEFLLILPGARANDVRPRVEDVIEKSNLLRVRESGNDMLRLLVSVGAAEFTGEHDLEAAVEKADNAMYARKSERKKLGDATPGPTVFRLA